MSVPDGFSMLNAGLDSRGHDELARHRAKVFEALSRHSDPALREVGRQLASGVVTPKDLLDEPRFVDVLRRSANQLATMNGDELQRRVLGFPRPTDRPGRDPDDREGGVPAVRR
jgi:hypothetical protein